MAENNINNTSQNEEDANLYGEGLGEKILNGIKSNLSFLIVIAISIVFIFSGYIKVVFQVDDVWAIICSSILGIMVGWVIKSLLGKQGLINGLSSKKCLSVMEDYNKLCKDNNDKSEYYPAYCEIKNEQKIKNYQTSILTSVNLKYSKFIAGEYDNKAYYTNIRGEKVEFTKKQIKALEKARNPKIVFITPDYLTNEMALDIIKEKKEVSTKKYEASRNTKTLFTSLFVGTISGFFMVSMLIDSSVANIIWTSIQVLVYIALGFSEYIRRYIWATSDHISYIKRRCAYLIEFRNMIKNNSPILLAKIKQFEEESKLNEELDLEDTNVAQIEEKQTITNNIENNEKEIIENGN